MGLRFKAGALLFLLCSLVALAPASARADGLDLGAYKGKVVYLDFWASWCAPCRLSFPWMNRIQQTYGRQGLVVIAVDVDHDRALADRFLADNFPQFKIVYDPKGAIATKYNCKAMPTSILIGRDGKIHYVHAGFHPEREGTYLSHLETLLNEKAS